jgi:hypothetical protein
VAVVWLLTVALDEDVEELVVFDAVLALPVAMLVVAGDFDEAVTVVGPTAGGVAFVLVVVGGDDVVFEALELEGEIVVREVEAVLVLGVEVRAGVVETAGALAEGVAACAAGAGAALAGAGAALAGAGAAAFGAGADAAFGGGDEVCFEAETAGV